MAAAFARLRVPAAAVPIARLRAGDEVIHAGGALRAADLPKK